MQATNAGATNVKITDVVGGFKLVTTEIKVQVPVYEDIEVKVPKFVEEPIKIPTGWDNVIKELAVEISKKVLDSVESQITARLDKAIDQRIKEIKYPKITEEVSIKYTEVPVDRPVFKDIEVSNPIYKNVEVINPVLRDVEVINAVIVDRTVTNAVIKDVPMVNALIKDVEVERAVIREKVVEVTHKLCKDEKGNSL